MGENEGKKSKNQKLKKEEEVSEQDKELGRQENMQKRVVFYDACLNAWVANRMELDKQLLILSSLAIGFLTIFYDKLENVQEFVIWFLAGMAFISTITATMYVFHKNTEYIQYLISNDNKDCKEKYLEKILKNLTKFACIAFTFGIALTFILIVMKSGFIITKTEE